MNELRRIVLDNLSVQANIQGIKTYKQLSKVTGLNINTIKKWYSRKIEIYPRIASLDRACDALEIHTSDLFVPSSRFEHVYTKPNDSSKAFRDNFNQICIDIGYTKVQSRIRDFFDEDRDKYYSYLRHNRTITIDALEAIASKMSNFSRTTVSASDLIK